MTASSRSDFGGGDGVKLRVRMRNSRVLSFSTTVRPTRSVLRVADHTFAASSRMRASSASSGTSCSNVSSAEIDIVGRSGFTSPRSMPCASSESRRP